MKGIFSIFLMVGMAAAGPCPLRSPFPALRPPTTGWGTMRGESREWRLQARITDDSYETLYGLKAGRTVDEAEALGYPLGTQISFGPGPGTRLEVTVEDGVITELETWWGMGRYIGKFFEP